MIVTSPSNVYQLNICNYHNAAIRILPLTNFSTLLQLISHSLTPGNTQKYKYRSWFAPGFDPFQFSLVPNLIPNWPRVPRGSVNTSTKSESVYCAREERKLFVEIAAGLGVTVRFLAAAMGGLPEVLSN